MSKLRLCVTLSILAVSAPGVCEDISPREAVQDIVKRAAENGTDIVIHFQFLGTRARGKIVSASDEGLTLDANGFPANLKWADVSPEKLAAAAASVAESGNDLLILAKYYMELNLPEKAEETAAAAKEKDPGTAPGVNELLREIHPPIEPRAVLIIHEPEKKPVRQIIRKNHAGRVLPQMPNITEPTLFNTPAADGILASMQIFPMDNPWNKDISQNPVHPKSDEIVASMGAGNNVHCNRDMAFVLVPPNQQMVNIDIGYSGESDAGPYPVPDNAPIEGLADQFTGDGDRHVIVVDPMRMILYEMFHSFRLEEGGWKCSSAAKFDLNSNKLRPRGWTSADAAGLPIFPAVVRYDECERGMVEHAIRVTARRTRRKYLYPATHHASDNTSETVPAMGQRFRLRADVNISGFSKHAKAVALGLKKYGMFVADNGSDWYISTAPDDRLSGLRDLHRLKGSDFEVVVTYDKAGNPQY